METKTKHTMVPRKFQSVGETSECPACGHKVRPISDGSLLCVQDPDFCDCLCQTQIDKERDSLPWFVGAQVAVNCVPDDTPAYHSIENGAEQIARVVIKGHAGHRAKKYADLIAAAPDLLAACYFAKIGLEASGRGKGCNDWEMVRAAIAKAEGR